MGNKYLIYGIFILLLYSYAEITGWKCVDSILAGTWRPVGRSTFHK